MTLPIRRRVLKYASKHGLRAAAREFDCPYSTVRLWRSGGIVPRGVRGRRPTVTRAALQALSKHAAAARSSNFNADVAHARLHDIMTDESSPMSAPRKISRGHFYRLVRRSPDFALRTQSRGETPHSLAPRLDKSQEFLAMLRNLPQNVLDAIAADRVANVDETGIEFSYTKHKTIVVVQR